MQKKTTPFLWFNDNAEEAAKFYVSVFKNSKILSVTRWPKEALGKQGTVMIVKFEIDGDEFVGLNGGPTYSFTEAISFWVKCDNQDEIDELWEKLSAGGEKRECGWLKDKFGVCWQIVPSSLEELIADDDQERFDRVMKTVWQMEKLDIRELQKAYQGGEAGSNSN